MSIKSNIELLTDKGNNEWTKIFYFIKTNESTTLMYTANKKGERSYCILN